MSQEKSNHQAPSTSKQELSEQKLKKQPLWKRQIIKTLQGTISVLETTVVKLEDTPVESVRDKSSFLNQLLNKLQLVWSNFLNVIRKLLPNKIATKLSENALTGIFLGIVVTFLLVVPNIFTNQISETKAITKLNPTPPTEPPNMSEEVKISETLPEEISIEEIQVNPQAEIQTEEKQKETETLSIEEPEEIPQSIEIPVRSETKAGVETETEILPSPQIEIETDTDITVEVETEPETKPETELEVKSIEKLVEEPVSTPETIFVNQPTPNLTPEQTLIASIQNQLADISNDNFVSGVIKSVQANFGNSTLTLTINNEWYSLKEREQNKLGTTILQRSQELDFNHMEIIDSEGKLVARNPVVGNEIIIFTR